MTAVLAFPSVPKTDSSLTFAMSDEAEPLLCVAEDLPIA
jgi:hypothetical protein